MFSLEPVRSSSILDSFFEFQSACFHEAGHAVLGYLLGQGCSSITVSVHYTIDQTGRPIGVAYGGVVMMKTAHRQVTLDIQRGAFTRTLLHCGISFAAGPAAERRFRLISEMPLRLAFATLGDHRNIDLIARRLEEHGRSSAAYQRLVWASAQRLFHVPEIWDCVSQIADELILGADLSGSEDDSYTLPGTDARAIMNERRIRPSHAARWLAKARAGILTASIDR